MELSFIISAIRRRFWLIILFTILGGVIGMAVSRSQDTSEYETTAALLVQPPAQGGITLSNNEPDRYPLGQQRALESLALADQVAAKMQGETAQSVHESVTIKHRSGTDILEIVARGEDPARVQTIANLYADTYLANQASNPADTQQVGLEQFNNRIKAIDDRLAVIGPLINDSFRPNPSFQNIPPQGDQVLIAERENLQAERNAIVTEMVNLEAQQISRVTSSIVERAVVPTDTVATSSRLYVLAGLIGGFALGLVGAILAARLSTKVLDRYEAETVLNQPVAGELIHAGGLTRSRAAALYELPSALEQVVSRICARAQANAADDRPLVIAVVGTQRNAGATTVALAMAGRFARTDLNSVIVDFDSHDPELTELFATDTGGIPTVLSYMNQPSSNGAPMSSQSRSRRIDPTTIYASTPVDRVRVIGAGADHDTLTLRRSEITRILDFAARDVDVVIADAGSLPDGAAAEQLVRIADCVVLAVPLSKLRASVLDTTARLLSGRSELILPVLTHPGRSKFSGRSTPAPKATEQADDEELAGSRN